MDKNTKLYTMSGAETTIAERDSMTEEQRQAEIRSKLFTLFDEDKERERELEEQDSFKKRATGTFNVLKKNLFGEEEDDSEARAGEPRRAQQRGQEPPRREQRGQEPPRRAARYDDEGGKLVRPARERSPEGRIEQEHRARPVNPVRARAVDGIPKTAASAAPATEIGNIPDPVPGDAVREMAIEETIVPARTKDAEQTAQERSDASFRLGDLFRDEEPDYLKPDYISRWEEDDEEERRIRERRERRRAEAVRRTQGEDDGSKLRAGAMVFVLREGIMSVFGRVGGPISRSEEREEEERAAEQALKELKAAKEEDTGFFADKFPPQDDSAEAEKPVKAVETKKPVKAATAEKPIKAERAARRGKSADEPSRADLKRAARTEKKAFAQADRRESIEPETPVKAEKEYADEEYESVSIRDYFKNPPAPSRTMIAWIAGGAAGAAAVVVIAFTIVGMHFA
jgi:hypothetical protein